jgi:hypothetical protein
MWLVDTTQKEAAVAALRQAGLNSPPRHVRRARWNYAQIYDWFRYIHSHLRNVGVNLWAIDEFNNRILYGVLDEAAGHELDRQLKTMHIPCFLVAIEVIGPIRGAGKSFHRRLTNVAADKHFSDATSSQW